MEDAFPNDATQWSDRDGDGYGDNASGYRGDVFPDDPAEWADEDADGHGDNSDACPAEYGTSSLYDMGGCPDTDGDGFADESEVCPGEHGTATHWSERGCPDLDGDSYADNFSDTCPGVFGTASRNGMHGCPDMDFDGFADPGSAGALATAPNIDRCPGRYGDAHKGEYIGCRDRDGDGWADVEDDLPDDGDHWIDSDGDGVADEEDVFANNRFLADESDVAALIFLAGFVASLALLVVSSKRKAQDDVLSAELTVWLNQFRAAPSNDKNYETGSAEAFEKNDLR